MVVVGYAALRDFSGITPTSPDGQEAYHTHVMAELMRLAEETAKGPTVIDAAYIEQEVNRHLPLANADVTASGEGKDRHGNRQRSEDE